MCFLSMEGVLSDADDDKTLKIRAFDLTIAKEVAFFIIEMRRFLWVYDTREKAKHIHQATASQFMHVKIHKACHRKRIFSHSCSALVLNFISVSYFTFILCVYVCVQVRRVISSVDLWCEHCTSIQLVLTLFFISFPRFRLCSGIVLSLEIRCTFAHFK